MSGKNFYRLKSPKSARVEGRDGKVSVLLIFGIIFTAVILGAVIYTFVKDGSFKNQSLTAVAFFGCFGLAFLIFGIHQQIKHSKNNRANRELLNNCLCTDGIISECTCQERRTSRHGDADRYYYDVTVSYYFYNDANEIRYNTFKHTYNNDPEFYIGQWVMVAFNDNDNAVLGKFEFVKEDEERFLKNEAERSADDFDNLYSTPVRIDPSQKIRSAELEHVWVWVASIMMFVDLLFIVPFSIFAVPQLLTGKFFPDVLVYLIIYLIAIVFISISLSLFVKFFKKRRYFKKILKNNPEFVMGKIFASEKTYRSKARKKVFYCYIDRYGGRHTKAFSGPAFQKEVQGYRSDVVIMYDKDGNSIPLYNYNVND